jgi:hypothetical protein
MIVQKNVRFLLSDGCNLLNFYFLVLLLAVKSEVERHVGFINKLADEIAVLHKMQEIILLIWISRCLRNRYNILEVEISEDGTGDIAAGGQIEYVYYWL